MNQRKYVSLQEKDIDLLIGQICSTLKLFATMRLSSSHFCRSLYIHVCIVFCPLYPACTFAQTNCTLDLDQPSLPSAYLRKRFEREREYVKDGYVEFVSPRISFEGKSILLKNQPLNFQKSFHLHISTFFPWKVHI